MFITIHTFHIWPRGGEKKPLLALLRHRRTLRRHTHIRLSNPPWLRHTALRTRLQRFAWMLSSRHYDSYKLNLYWYNFFFFKSSSGDSTCVLATVQKGMNQDVAKRNRTKKENEASVWCLRGCVARQRGNGPKSNTPSRLFMFSKNHSLHHTTRHWFRFFFVCLFSFFF